MNNTIILPKAEELQAIFKTLSTDEAEKRKFMIGLASSVRDYSKQISMLMFDNLEAMMNVEEKNEDSQ